MESKNPILVPTDFSDTCFNAIVHAAKIAKNNDIKLVMLHVINRETRTQLRKDKLGLEAIIVELEGLKDQVQVDYNIEVDYIAREGSIFEVIEEVAKEIKAQLMVLGTHGKKGLQYLLGGFAFKVITKSPCPVIVVQEHSDPVDIKRVLFPINIYTEPRQQVQMAVRIGTRFNRELMVYKQKFTDSLAVNKLESITQQILREFDRNEINYVVDQAEKTSNFTAQLINYAENNNADYIMMMTDGSIDNPDFNNSAWSEKLIYNEASIPVLCINPVYLGETYFSF